MLDIGESSRGGRHWDEVLLVGVRALWVIVYARHHIISLRKRVSGVKIPMFSIRAGVLRSPLVWRQHAWFGFNL